jgi:hypothetical protein
MSTYSGQMTPITRLMKGSGATIRVLYPGYRGSPVTAQEFGYDRFPPTTNDWGTMHPVPDTTPPLLCKEDRPPK